MVDAVRLLATLAAGVAIWLPLYGCGGQAANPPEIVAPSRPDTLRSEPVPATLEEALDALSRGLSGRDFQAMQLLTEEDAVAATDPVARWLQKQWLQPADSRLHKALAAAGFAESDAMSDAVLRSFWRRLHDRDLDLNGQAREAGALRREALRSARSVVFPAHSAAGLAQTCSRPAPGPVTGAWIPDANTIRRLEQALGPALQDALDRRPPIAEWTSDAADYYRQYGGLIIDGRRIVYVNGFHQRYHAMTSGTVHPGHWRQAPVIACDGGRDFFGAVYDPATGRIESLDFNS